MLERGCSCGSVRYRLTFVINALIEADRVELVQGEPQAAPVPRDDGSSQTIWRCPACRVALFSEYGRPEVRFVRAGTLDDPAAVAPVGRVLSRSVE